MGYLIVDVGVEAGVKEVLAGKFGLTILDAQEMTSNLLAWQGWEHLDPWSTLIVLPGNGASIVKKYIEKVDPFWLWQWPWKAFPHAKRVWIPGENPRSYVGRINPGVLVGIKTVVVIDDVISSGETVGKLRKENKSFIPVAEWWALTWVKQRASSTKGYSAVFAAKTVGTEEHKVPINSLSTLIERPEIAECYARRNFGNEAKDFGEILKIFR
ncbi:phosphoribosyltransferase [Candidatus Falkowbacteria bacterium]|nr:phosphoribosyltransferase [Candidatus Falkowbacteria bacterium]